MALMDGLVAFRYCHLGREVVNGGGAGTKVNATAQWRGQGSYIDDRKRKFVKEDISYLMGKGRTMLPRTAATVKLAPTPVTYEQFPYLLASSIKGRSTGIQDGAGSGYVYTYAVPNVETDVQNTSTGISFTLATKVIADSNSTMGHVGVGDKIEVDGSTSNDGIYTVTAAAANSLTVSEALADEAAGDTVTIKVRKEAYTVEVGDNKRNIETAYGVVTDWVVEGSGGVETDALMMSATIAGRQFDAVTKTTLSAPTVADAFFPRTSLYIDAVAGTIGTNQKTGMMLGWRLAYTSGVVPLYTGGGNLYFESAQLRKEPSMVLEIDLLETADMLTQVDNWIAGTPILLRLQELGPALATSATHTYKTIRFDLPGTWENFGEPQVVADGSTYRTGTFVSHYDATASLGPSVVVVNELSALT